MPVLATVRSEGMRFPLREGLHAVVRSFGYHYPLQGDAKTEHDTDVLSFAGLRSR
jgi:hypothetical protein